MVELDGAYTVYYVLHEGRRVPFLTGMPLPDGGMELILDRRFSLTLAADQAHSVAAFVADAIAVALGYTCHPREDWDGPIRMHPFGGRVMGVTLNPSPLAVVPDPPAPAAEEK